MQNELSKQPVLTIYAMSTNPKSNVQLYQVALAIGNSYNLKEMISESLAGYQKYLDCNACAVLQYKKMLEGDFYRIDEIVEPNNKILTDIVPIDSDFIPNHLSTANLKELWEKMPVCINHKENVCIYVMSLPDFGFILLRKTNGYYTPEELLAIGELNLKLAKCALQCRISDELTECLTKYDNLINLIPEMIFETDIKGNLLFTNDVAKKVMGLEEVLQSGIVYNVFDFIHKKDIARAKSNLQKALTTNIFPPREYMLTTTRGENIETILYTSQIVDKGNVVGIRGVVLDITDRKNIERKIREKSEKLEMVLLGSDAGLWDWNVLTDEFFFNDRWSTMLGYEPTEITPNKEVWVNLFHPQDKEIFKTEINKLLRGEIPFIATDLRIKSKNDGYKWISESARIVEHDDLGNVVRVIGIHIDITDAKLAQETLKNSLLQQELISGIAISLNSLENFDDKINIVLRVIGEYLNVSRVYVFQDNEDGDKTSNTNEWCNKGIRSEKDSLQNVHYSTIPSWRKIIEERGMLFCDDTTTLPNDIRKLTDAENILSIIEYPLYTEGKYAGFIGFDECVQKREWTKWELELLKTITGIIANAIERQKIDIVLKNSYSTNKAIIDSLPDRLLHVTNNGILINFNRVECGFCSNVQIKVGEHINSILPLEGVKIIEEGIQACVGQGSIMREAKFEKDGDELYFEFSFSESADKTVIILARNITNRRRSEESIRYNEVKFRELFDLMPLGMAFNDFETGQYIDCNQELLDQLGYSRQELMAQSFWNISPNKYIKTEGQQLKRLLKTGRYGPYEKELIRRDGSRYPVELAGFITKDRNGRNLFCSSIKDLTSDKQHIANLQQSEEKFRELFELSPIGLVFCDIETGAFLDCNENILKQTGYTRNEFLRLTLWDITPAEYGNLNSKSFETLKKTGKYGPIEKEYLRKDGSRYPISVSGFLTKDKSGKQVVCANIQDLTDTKTKNEKLRKSEEKFRGLFELSPIGICQNDFRTKKYLDWNDSLLNMVGYSREEFVDLDYWDTTPIEFAEEEDRIEFQILRDGYYNSYEKEFIAKDGRRIPVLLTGFLIHDSQGRELVWSSIQDISELKKRAEQLTVSEQKFRGLFEQLPIGVALTDNTTAAYLECNNAFLAMLGYTAEEIIGHYYWDITPIECTEIDKQITEQLNSTGHFGPFEKVYTKKTGEQIPVVLNGYLSVNFEGKPVVWTAIQDISVLKKNEFDLRRSEEKFRNFVENASDIILSTSLQGHTLYVSPNITKMLGYSQEEFMKMPLHQYVNSEDLKNYFKLVKDYQIRGIPSENMEYRMLHKNGEWRWVQVTTSVNRDSNGNLYSISILRDFTKDKIAQEQLKRLSLVASKTTNTIVITDKNKRITWINEAFSTLTGYTYEEVIGKDPGKILQGSGTSIRDIEIINNGLKSGKAFRSEIYNYTKTGRGYWIEIYFTPIYDDTDQITSYIAVENDITERKNNEEQIIKLTKGIENSPTIVVITDKEGNIEYVNNRFVEITGYTMPEVLGKTPRILKSGFQSRKLYEDLWNTIKSGDNWKGELYNMKKDGSYYWELATISPILNANNEITHYIAIKEDITERKKLYEEVLSALEKAEKATRAKSEFLATMSHEIRTPMNGVIGMTSLLAKTPLTEEQLDFVNTIRNSGDALLSIINDILDFSKIESGRMEMDIYPFDIRQCVEDVIDLFWVKANQKAIYLNYTVSPTINRQLLGDVTRLRQVLVNLVGNAIKFTEKGFVKISIIKLDEDKTSRSIKLCFKIEDSGLGIAEDKIVKLFSPFSQIDSSITRRFGGTGLGLAITKRLVELMGGYIKVESTENVGSCFSFEINFKYSDLEDASANGRSFASLKIFEDIADQSVGTTLTNLLQALGVAVVQSEQAASVIFTDKETYQQSTTPVVFLKNMDCKIDEENSYFTIITLPLKIASVKNGLQKMFVKPHPILRKAAVDMSEETLAQRVPISILVAEDNTINQKLMNKSLSFYGYTADIAANGLEVIQALERQPYDLIFMDLQMPEMDGLEATKQIVSRYKDSRPVIVAMTASALGVDKEACFEAGMDDYVSKPIKIDVLEEMIVKWCGGGKIRASNNQVF